MMEWLRDKFHDYGEVIVYFGIHFGLLLILLGAMFIFRETDYEVRPRLDVHVECQTLETKNTEGVAK